MFLVDALDRDRFGESRKELDSLLSDEALAQVMACKADHVHTQWQLCSAGHQSCSVALSQSDPLAQCPAMGGITELSASYPFPFFLVRDLS